MDEFDTTTTYIEASKLVSPFDENTNIGIRQ